MLSKFSVKKPLTVLVAVIVVLVLGVVSYTRMTPDLLPSIDLPYVLVMTTYPGATPEKVESTVTKPLEQAMATLENINAVQSTSAANYSTVILEFTDDVNMDSITVDILQKIEAVEGYWDDMVGTPMILKINPNMLPVMVAAVSVDGMDTAALSEFTNETLLPALEGTSGIASISCDGLLKETVRVTLDETRIDKLNKKLREQIDKTLDESLKELENAKAEIENGKAEMESGKQQLESGKQELNEQTSDAQSQIGEKQNELNNARLQITVQIAQLKDQLAALEQTEGQLTTINNSLSELENSKNSAKEELTALREIASALEDVAAKQLEFAGLIAQIELNPALDDAQKAAAIEELKKSDDYLATEAASATAKAQLAARGLDELTLAADIAKLTLAVEGAEAGLSALDAALEELGMSREMLSSSLAELQSGKTQLTDAIAMLEGTLKELDAGQVQLSAALKELEIQKTAAMFELSSATTKLLTGEMQLDSAATQIEEGFKALEDGRKTAYDSADLETILSAETVSSLLMAQNFAMPAGYVSDNGADIMVSIGDAVTSLDDLQQLVLLDLNMDGIDAITLSDVATVERVNNSDEVYARVNGENGVLLSFSKQSNFATAEASENLMKRFEELSEEHEGLAFSPLMDQGDYIFLVVESIMSNLLFSALFAVLVLFLFLGDLKPTLITLLSIPLSVLFAIVLMYFSGVTLNMISMSALAVSIGMLVDNSVVVIENIYRLRFKGIDPLRAAVSGATQVTGAIIASTLTTVCVFLPIVFVDGLTRDLFTDMALTIGYSLLASLIVALTLVPAMSTKLLKNAKEKTHPLFDKFLGGYRKALAFSLNKKWLVLVVSVVLLFASVALALLRGFSFMPEMSSTQMTVTVTLPDGSAADDTKSVTDEAMSIIRGIEGVQTVGAMLASDMMTGQASDTSATMYVILEDSYFAKSGEIAEEINTLCASLDGEVVASASAMDMSMLFGSGVAVNFYGDDLDVLQATVSDAAKLLADVKSVQNVSDGMEDADPELHFTVDKAAAAKKGLTVAQVYAEIAKALTNETTSTTLTENGKNYDVLIVSDSQMTKDELMSYSFTVKNTMGETLDVKLAEIASAEEALSPAAINRDDQRRYMTLTAEVADGHNVTLATADVKKVLASLDLPRGVTMEFTGENETVMEAVEQMALMLLLGMIFVYLVMVAQFQSLKSPFIVMFTIPLAFTGGFIGLLVTGLDVSVISLIGFVMLCGIIVNNGIVLVDYINQLRADGTPKREALLEAGVTRMRPILMTSVTTILGMLVTALGNSSGSDMMQPIAVVCIGGLFYATLMTLFVIPVLYDLFNRKELTVITDDQLTEVEE